VLFSGKADVGRPRRGQSILVKTDNRRRDYAGMALKRSPKKGEPTKGRESVRVEEEKQTAGQKTGEMGDK